MGSREGGRAANGSPAHLNAIFYGFEWHRFVWRVQKIFLVGEWESYIFSNPCVKKTTL